MVVVSGGCGSVTAFNSKLTVPDLKMIVTLYARGVPQKAVAIIM